MELGGLDRWGFLLPHLKAFECGQRVGLECTGFDGHTVLATTYHDAMPRINVRCLCPVWASNFLDVGRRFSLVDFKICQTDDGVLIQAVSGDLLPIMHPTPDSKAIGEAFAGLGGWSWGAHLMGAKPVLLVDSSPIAAEACARAHELQCLSIEEAISLVKVNMLPDRMVLRADILDLRVWFLAGILHISHWLASPPCPPWSSASREAGLCCIEGALFVEFIFMIGVSHAACVSLENVPGLPKHPHYGLLTQAMNAAGLALVVSNVDKVNPLLPVFRTRWLATCVRKEVQVDPIKVKRAKNLAFPNTVLGVGKENSMGAAGILQNLEPWELEQCIPTPDALEIMRLPEYLPLNLRTPGYMAKTGDQVIALRTKTARQLLPSVMAMQGSQHLLPPDLLAQKGLHAFLVWDGSVARFAAPFEIALGLGFSSGIWLPTSFKEAWLLTGNSLSIAHATLQCTRTQWIMGDVSGLPGCFQGIFDVCKSVLAHVCTMEGLHTRVEGSWMTLDVHFKPEPVPVPMSTICIDDDDDDAGETAVSPIGERLETISPTIPFFGADSEITGPRDPVLVPMLAPRPLESMARWTFATKHPITGHLTVRDAAGLDVAKSNARFYVMHSQMIWACTFDMQCPVEVGRVLRYVFPHASPDHFAQIHVDQQSVWFHTVLEGKLSFNVVFQPCSFPRVVSASFLEKDIVCEVDVAWTFTDMAAFAAAEANVLAASVQIFVHDTVYEPNAFVLATPHGCFDAEIIETAAPVHQGSNEVVTRRLTVKHPKWDNIRSGAFAAATTIGEALEELLPGYPGGAMPLMVHDGMCIDPRATVASIPSKGVQLCFPGGPARNCERLICIGDEVMPPMECDTVALTFRTPFAFRSQTKAFPKHWTVLDLVNSVLLEVPCNMTIVVVANGKGIDPHTQLQHIAETAILDVRACCLPGGGKNQDATAKSLQQMLLARGVPDDVVASRIALIKSKIQPSELATIVSMDPVKAWTALKSMASDQKVRLVTVAELKQFQQSQRQNKTKGGAASSSSTGKPPNTNGTKPKDSKKAPKVSKVVNIDPSHFVADGYKLNLITEAQWGPDATGLLVTTPEAAMKRLPVTVLSPDPLAAIVMTSNPFQGIAPVLVPAVDETGQPTLASVAVVNFGEVVVACTPSLPTADLPAIQTSIIEVSIVKQFALHTLGWEATVIKPAGRSAWLACSETSPPATHLCLGADYVAVVPLVKTSHAKSHPNADAEMVPGPVNFSMCPDEEASTTSTTATRMSDLEDKLTAMINQKASSVQEVKGHLQQVVDETKKEFREVREQQNALQNSIQTQIQTSNNGLLEQMQSMFKNLQQDLKSTIQSNQGDNEGEPNRSRSRSRAAALAPERRLPVDHVIVHYGHEAHHDVSSLDNEMCMRSTSTNDCGLHCNVPSKKLDAVAYVDSGTHVLDRWCVPCLQWLRRWVPLQTDGTPMFHGGVEEHNFQVAWSAPVRPYAYSKADLRGQAGGTAVLSPYPLRTVVEDHPRDIMASNRFCETHVQYAPHRFLQCISLYGPTATYKYADHNALRNHLFTYAAQRVVRFQGPSIILGDMNAPMESLHAWQTLVAAGWVDAALQSSQMHGHPLEPTSSHQARHSFVLVSPDLAAALVECRTCDHYKFAVHPVLKASFRWETILVKRRIWALPSSFDKHLNDPTLLDFEAKQSLLQAQTRTLDAVAAMNVDEFNRIWTYTAERALAKSVVDCEGNRLHVSNAHLGRHYKPRLQERHVFVPRTKRARHGELQPMCDQCSVQMRRHLKQAHRLQSLRNQLVALQKRYSVKAYCQAADLWTCILQAKGFFPDFGHWVQTQCLFTVQPWLPPLETVRAIADAFVSWHKSNENAARLAKTNIARIDLIADLAKGGRLAFNKTKLPGVKPLTQIHAAIELPVERVRWSLSGKVFLPGQFHDLDPNLPVRVQLARALCRDGAGCNAWLACSAIDQGLDPELRTIYQRLLVWQRFSRLFPEEMHGLQELFCRVQSTPRLHTKPGPIAAFVASLRQLGVSFGAVEGTFDLEGRSVHWLQLGKKALKRVLEDAWTRFVCQQCTTRKNFHIPSFDVSSNCKVFQQLSYEDRPYIESLVVGKHYTGDVLSKFLPAVSGACPLCGGEDSRHHRVFECAIERVLPSDDSLCHHVFTDGSGFFGDEPKLTLSAGGFVELPWGEQRIVCSGGAPVPGFEQNSFLGEMFAVYLALTRFWALTVYTDCQGICDLVQELAHGDQPTTYHSQYYSYLWQAILWHVKQRPPGSLRVVKVKAHMVATPMMDAYTCWLIWGNNAADQRAKDVVLKEWRTVYNKVSNSYKRCSVQRSDLRILYQLVVAANRLLLAFPWGPIYLWRILQWAAQLVWEPMGSSRPSGDIAFVELLVDYILFTGTWPPRNVSTQSQRNSNYGFGEYVLDDLGNTADVQALPLAAHSNIWQRTMMWLIKFLPGLVLKGSVVKRTTSLALLGSPAWHSGLDTRPALACQFQAATTLVSYYITKLGCKRNMDRILQVPLRKPVSVPASLHTPFKIRLAGIRRAQEIFTTWRDGV
eukprot:Skav217127  [mRNA]  locus=scaffold783:404163:414538:+ [translate_table: standard]